MSLRSAQLCSIFACFLVASLLVEQEAQGAILILALVSPKWISTETKSSAAPRLSDFVRFDLFPFEDGMRQTHEGVMSAGTEVLVLPSRRAQERQRLSSLHVL